MSKVQTDNSYLYDKIMLRIKHLPDKKQVRVLDCFAGSQLIWDYIIHKSKAKIIYTPIDSIDTGLAQLKGDNLKFLKVLDLNQYDVIDLDAYGVPYKQLRSILPRLTDQVVFVTFIQSFYGGLPYAFLKDIGYPVTMIRKVPTLFFKNGFEKLKLFLALNGVQNIHFKSIDNKHYLSFVKNVL